MFDLGPCDYVMDPAMAVAAEFFGAAKDERPLKIDYATRRIEANKECSRTATRRLMVVFHDFNVSCNFYKHRIRRLCAVEFSIIARRNSDA